MRSLRRQLMLAMLCASATFTLASSSTANPTVENAIIAGRILNLDTGEYVRNAMVGIEGTAKSTVSEDGGYYRLTNVPAGEVRLLVTYTGYPPLARAVRVAPGTTTLRDFEISSHAAETTADGTVKMGAVVVSSVRVGESKAIMQQRISQDITNVVASEAFGDNASGNIAEFLQNVPGVELDIDRGEATTVRLRGLPSEYTSVTFDGLSLASADAAGAVTPSRALNFQNFSLDSIESIEISKTVSADVDANAPAGIINLRPKRAFDLAGRRVVIETHVNAHGDYFSLKRTTSPTDSLSRKILPGGKISYSDVVMGRRLGFNLTVSADKRFSDHTEVRHVYDYAPTAADPRPMVPTEIRFAHTPRMDYRDTASLAADFKATPNLVLSLAALYNSTELVTWQREIVFGLGARGTVAGDDPMTSFTTTASNANVRSSPAAILKRSQSVSFLPKFEFRKEDLRIEGKFSGSDALGWYDPLHRAGAARDLLGGTTPTLSGVRYTGTRSSTMTGDWKIVQIAGRDWADGANFTTGSPRNRDGRAGDTFSYSAEVAATLTTNSMLPIVWKAGVKRQGQDRTFKNDTALGVQSLTGAPSTGGWADYRSPFEYDAAGSGLDATMSSISGGRIWVPDLKRIGALLLAQPESFTNVVSASNYFTAVIDNSRELEETIDAAFFMATAQWGKASIRAGMRWEDTTTDVVEFDPLSAAETRAAGYAVSATTGRASTVEGLKYQYHANPRIHRVGHYDNLFPSASLKIPFRSDIELQLNFSSTIRRPAFGDLTGSWTVNDTARTVSAPNKDLGPEKSRNFALRLAKYFEPRGVLAFNTFQNNVRGLYINNRLTEEEFGYQGDENYSGYAFITTTQAGEVTVRGMEWEFNQQMSFLPRPFDSLSLRGSYTRSYADIPVSLIVPHSITGGLTYSRGKVTAYANYTWRDTHALTLGTNARSYRHEGKMDIGGSYRIGRKWRLYFRARDILNTPRIVLEQNGGNPQVAYGYFTNGTLWTFGGECAF